MNNFCLFAISLLFVFSTLAADRIYLSIDPKLFKDLQEDISLLVQKSNRKSPEEEQEEIITSSNVNHQLAVDQKATSAGVTLGKNPQLLENKSVNISKKKPQKQLRSHSQRKKTTLQKKQSVAENAHGQKRKFSEKAAIANKKRTQGQVDPSASTVPEKNTPKATLPKKHPASTDSESTAKAGSKDSQQERAQPLAKTPDQIASSPSAPKTVDEKETLHSQPKTSEQIISSASALKTVDEKGTLLSQPKTSEQIVSSPSAPKTVDEKETLHSQPKTRDQKIPEEPQMTNKEPSRKRSPSKPPLDEPAPKKREPELSPPQPKRRDAVSTASPKENKPLASPVVDIGSIAEKPIAMPSFPIERNSLTWEKEMIGDLNTGLNTSIEKKRPRLRRPAMQLEMMRKEKERIVKIIQNKPDIADYQKNTVKIELEDGSTGVQDEENLDLLYDEQEGKALSSNLYHTPFNRSNTKYHK